MQTLDVQAQTQGPPQVPKSGLSEKTGAETARNGSSFLSMIEKMIADSKEGMMEGKVLSSMKVVGREAGDIQDVSGDESTLKKQVAGMTGKDASSKKGTVTLGTPKSGSRDWLTARIGTGEAIDDGLSAEGKDESELSGAVKSSRTILAGTLIDEKTGIAESTEKDAVTDIPTGASRKKGSGIADAEVNGSAFAFALNDPEPISPGNSAAAGSMKFAGNDESELGGVAVSRVDRKDKKTLISVRDERTGVDPSVKLESPLAKAQADNGNVADMEIGFRGVAGGHSTAGENARLADRHESEGLSFANMLSQELKNNAADFVKTGQIVLRDNNAGTIRLTLHPESLGNVRISLELSGDRRISGKIHVSSREAYEAFNENLDGLSDAFVQGGFESAGFDLSWTGGEDGGGQRDMPGKTITPFYASSIPDVMSAAELSDTVTGGNRHAGNPAINIFA